MTNTFKPIRTLCASTCTIALLSHTALADEAKEDYGLLEEVIVTAQKREASMQDTTSSLLSFSVEGKQVDIQSVETLFLVKDEGHWKIQHAHWSSRPASK